MHEDNSVPPSGGNPGTAPFSENSSIKRFLAGAFQLNELSNGEQKELQKLATIIFIKAQKRISEKVLISGIENDIATWSHSASGTTSVAEKVKVAGIIDALKRDLQAQKSRENSAAKEMEQANSNFNLFRVKIAIANPPARKGLEEFRSQMEELLAHLSAVVSRTGK